MYTGVHIECGLKCLGVNLTDNDQSLSILRSIQFKKKFIGHLISLEFDLIKI